MDRPLVSIITPVYNGTQFLDRSIKSVQSQSFQNWELILIDDGSKDDSINVIEKYLSDERVMLFKNEANSGIPKTRNIGISHAKGKYIALLDQDDEWLEDKLLVQTEQFESLDSTYGLVYSNIRVELNDGKITEEKREIAPKDDVVENLRYMLLSNRISSPTVLIRKEVIMKVGAFDESIFWGGDDYDLWLRIASEYKFGFIDKVLCVRHEHGSNFSADKKNMMTQTIALAKKIIESEDIEYSFFKRVRSSHQYRYGIESIKEGNSLEGMSYIFRSLLGSKQGIMDLSKTIRKRF